jgi:quercetin dioxygenase-like cupin family protein
MLINRWTGQILPSPQQLKMLLVNEGLTPELETLPAHSNLKEHRHPFDEIRIILEGNLIMDINGNQLLLRPGDRIDVPANTKHSKTVHGGTACISLIAKRTF